MIVIMWYDVYLCICVHVKLMAITNIMFITKPKAESGNYQRERPMLHMLKLKSPENASLKFVLVNSVWNGVEVVCFQSCVL